MHEGTMRLSNMDTDLLDVVDSDMISQAKLSRQIRNLLERVCKVNTEIIQCFHCVAYSRDSSYWTINHLVSTEENRITRTNEMRRPLHLPRCGSDRGQDKAYFRL